MIAIDTNVLLRYLLADDTVQHNKAAFTIKSSQSVLITDIVLVETIWTLTGQRYKLDKQATCELLRSLIGDSLFIYEDVNTIWSALRDYEEASAVRGKKLDFPDALINQKAKYVARLKGKKLTAFYSFDKAVEQLSAAKIL